MCALLSEGECMLVLRRNGRYPVFCLLFRITAVVSVYIRGSDVINICFIF